MAFTPWEPFYAELRLKIVLYYGEKTGAKHHQGTLDPLNVSCDNHNKTIAP